MKKGIKVILIVSLLLNVGLVIGFGFYHNFVKSQMRKGLVMMAQAEESLQRHILSDLESNEPEKITALKERLRRNIEQARHVEELFGD